MPKRTKMIGKIGNIGCLGSVSGLVRGRPIVVSITVTDEDGVTPVMGASVTVDSTSYLTDATGVISVVGNVGRKAKLAVSKAGYPDFIKENWLYADTKVVMGRDSNNLILENGWDLLYEDESLILMEEQNDGE